MPSRSGQNTAQRGTTTVEQALLLSVLVVAVVGMAQQLVPLFQAGVSDLSLDVAEVLSGRNVPGSPGGGMPSDYAGGGDGYGGGEGGAGSNNGGGTGGSGSDESGTSEDGSSSDGSSSDGTGEDQAGGTDSAPAEEEPSEEEEEAPCPYVYDETSERWRDPETGQYVSSTAAAQAGC
ncbi:MAG: hypothetical protein ACKO6N_24200 [Myxococcota bacterium]